MMEVFPWKMELSVMVSLVCRVVLEWEQLAHRWVVRGGVWWALLYPGLSGCLQDEPMLSMGCQWAVFGRHRAATRASAPGGRQREPAHSTPAGLSLAFVWRLDL